MSVRSLELCRHCERGPRESELGLCSRCQEAPRIRLLYRKRRTPYGVEWERHLRALARRARRQLPLGGISLTETL